MSGIETYTKEEFEASYNMVFKEITKNKKPDENPTASFIGGQPGSGKTMLADMILKENPNTIFINSDEYRKYHPRYKEIIEKYGKESSIYTHKISSEITDTLIERLSDQKYNLIIEGTLRTSEIPLRFSKELKEKGYKNNLSLVSVKSEKSYLGNLLRYEKMLACGLLARLTPKEYHDMIIGKIADNVKEVDESKRFSNITIYNRDEELLFDSSKGDKNPEKVIANEFLRPMNKKDIDELNAGYNELFDYMKKRNASDEEILNAKKNKKEALAKSKRMTFVDNKIAAKMRKEFKK
ncbi:MAG: Toxin PezT [Alphaproteobacteria bacterium ADurb.Bin438]|nr:MAG: Toxin PezT [Alphaproteobacteria bacterium ADurb.Bin438]